MKKTITIISFFLLLLSTNLVMAAETKVMVKTPRINPLQGDKASPIYLPGANESTGQGQYIQSTFLPKATSIIISLTGGLSLLFVIISGIQILTAYNQEEKITAAKKTLMWAIIGFVISILSYAIVQVIVSIQLSPPPPK